MRGVVRAARYGSVRHSSWRQLSAPEGFLGSRFAAPDRSIRGSFRSSRPAGNFHKYECF